MSSIQLFVDGVKVYDNGAPMTTAQLAAAMQTAVNNGQMLTIGGGTFTVSSPIVITMSSAQTGPMGFDGGGCKFISTMTGGQDVITYQCLIDGVNLRFLNLKNFTIIGSGSEGNGLKVHVPTNASWIYNSKFEDIALINCGANGMLTSGSVFESTYINVSTDSNHIDGMQFVNATNGSSTGIVSAIGIFGGSQRNNGRYGMSAIGGPRDIKTFGAYYVGNVNSGCNFEIGFTGMWGCGFENNGGAGVSMQVSGAMWGCTGSTYGPMPYLINGYIVGNMVLEGCGTEGYNGGSIKTGSFNGGGAYKIHTLASGDASSFDIAGPVTLHPLDNAT